MPISQLRMSQRRRSVANRNLSARLIRQTFIGNLPPALRGFSPLGKGPGGTYRDDVEPLINHDEFIGKTVGRRRAPRDSLRFAFALQRTLNEMCPLRVPRGVFRFRSYEEADAWLMDHLTRKRES